MNQIEDDEGKDNKKHRGRTQDSADEHVQLKNIVEEDEDLDDFEDYYSTVLEESKYIALKYLYVYVLIDLPSHHFVIKKS